MKRVFLLILILIISSCKSAKLPFEEKTIIIKSNSIFNEKLKRYCLIQSNTLYGCQLHVNFKNQKLANNSFSINILNQDQDINLFTESNSTLLSSKQEENIITKIYAVNPKDEIKSYYLENYKVILIYKIQNGIIYVLSNDSNFDDNVSEVFLLERFKELKFTIKDKKMMKNVYRNRQK